MIVKLTEEHFESTKLKGWVEIDLPSPLERISIGSQITLDGADIASQLKQIESMAKIAWERIKGLELVHESGKEFKSLEEMSQYTVCHSLLSAVGGIILNGLPLGKG